MKPNTPKPSLRAAINEKCKDCTYDSAEPGAWRMQVEACMITDCALYAARPRSYKGK